MKPSTFASILACGLTTVLARPVAFPGNTLATGSALNDFPPRGNTLATSSALHDFPPRGIAHPEMKAGVAPNNTDNTNSSSTSHSSEVFYLIRFLDQTLRAGKQTFGNITSGNRSGEVFYLLRTLDNALAQSTNVISTNSTASNASRGHTFWLLAALNNVLGNPNNLAADDRNMMFNLIHKLQTLNIEPTEATVNKRDAVNGTSPSDDGSDSSDGDKGMVFYLIRVIQDALAAGNLHSKRGAEKTEKHGIEVVADTATKSCNVTRVTSNTTNDSDGALQWYIRRSFDLSDSTKKGSSPTNSTNGWYIRSDDASHSTKGSPPTNNTNGWYIRSVDTSASAEKEGFKVQYNDKTDTCDVTKVYATSTADETHGAGVFWQI